MKKHLQSLDFVGAFLSSVVYFIIPPPKTTSPS